jgi:hypothetical protein
MAAPGDLRLSRRVATPKVTLFGGEPYDRVALSLAGEAPSSPRRLRVVM